MNSLMHHPHQQHCLRSSHNQVLRAPPPFKLGHHIDRVDAEHGDIVNHLNPKITISLGPPINWT
jgi:hypothetical protein